MYIKIVKTPSPQLHVEIDADLLYIDAASEWQLKYEYAIWEL